MEVETAAAGQGRLLEEGEFLKLVLVNFIGGYIGKYCYDSAEYSKRCEERWLFGRAL